MRETMARSRPTRRAPFCWRAGSFPARIEMKMMLSIPSTISRAVNVRKPIQTPGCVIHSMPVSVFLGGRR